MVREEYLNPEFMYKLINSLCKADGWIMYHFVFGKLTYKNFEQPTLMQNNHGYNMVYKFQVYKRRSNVNYGKSIRYHNGIYVNSSNFKENIISKDIYFDILNECFVEHDDTVLNFEEFPSFFRLDNQLYYGIYGQPKILKYHYSKARDCYNIENYMDTMNINSHNLFAPHDLLCKLIDRNKKLDSYYSDEEWEFCFETQEEANSAITEVLSKTYTPYDFAKVYNVEENFRRRLIDYDSFKLYIHKSKFPIFYTDNVLELTLPIAESVKLLGSMVTSALHDMQETVKLLSNSVGQLMADRLSDHNIDIRADLGIKCCRKDMDIYYKHMDNILKSCVPTSNTIGSMQDTYEELYSNIQKIKTSEFSLNTALGISNGFKMLESKISAEK